MVTTRLHWIDLPTDARAAIEERLGPIQRAETVTGGFNSEIAAKLDALHGQAFVKGLRTGHPRAWTQRREAEIAAHTGALAPRFLWRLEAGGWDLLGFEYVEGRHADYAVGSADLVLLADTLSALAALPSPRIELKRAEDRWASYVDDPAALAALAGRHLCHTDFNPENVIITEGRAVLADWAWATLGAPWLDPALGAIWLIATGKQTPAEADRWASRMPTWRQAPADAVRAFANANARLWAEIAEDNPGAWSSALCEAAQQWAAFRSSL